MVVSADCTFGGGGETGAGRYLGTRARIAADVRGDAERHAAGHA